MSRRPGMELNESSIGHPPPIGEGGGGSDVDEESNQRTNCSRNVELYHKTQCIFTSLHISFVLSGGSRRRVQQGLILDHGPFSSISRTGPPIASQIGHRYPSYAPKWYRSDCPRTREGTGGHHGWLWWHGRWWVKAMLPV